MREKERRRRGEEEEEGGNERGRGRGGGREREEEGTKEKNIAAMEINPSIINAETFRRVQTDLRS